MTGSPAFALGTWVTKAPMPTARHGQAAAVVNGILYEIGGYAQALGGYLSMNEAYDPGTNAWTTKGPLPTPQQPLGTNGAVVNGIIYVVGGSSGGFCTGAVQAYDPVKDAWTTRSSMPTPRCHLAVAAINGLIYAAGGTDTSGSIAYRTFEVYDPVADSWTTKASMPTGRSQLGAGVVNGNLYVLGGFTDGVALATNESYDPGTDTWTTRASMPTARTGVGAGVVSGLLYAVGGETATGTALSTNEVYDPTANSWSTENAMPTARASPGVAVLGGAVYVAGGFNGPGPNADLNTVEAFTPGPASFLAITTVASDLGRPFSVAVHNGFAFVADPSSHRVWMINVANGQKTVVAGTGEQGFNGDGIPAVQAQLDNPSGVAVDANGVLYIADTGNHAVRKVATPGVAGALISTVAGIPTSYAVGESTPAACAAAPTGSQCVVATALRLYGPRALAVDGAGNVYIADRMNQQIKKLYTSGPLSGFIFVVAGVAGYTGSNDGRVSGSVFCPPNVAVCFVAARFNSPVGVAVDASGNVYVADEGNNRIRVVSPGNADVAASVSTLSAGSLLRPTGVAVAANGDVYIANYGRHLILLRSCPVDCTITTVAGTGTAGSHGTEGGPATSMQLNSPIAVALDGTTLYIADMLNGRILAVNPSSNIIP